MRSSGRHSGAAGRRVGDSPALAGWLTRLQLLAIRDQLDNPIAGSRARRLNADVGRGRPALVPIKIEQTVNRETEHCDALYLGVGPRTE